MARAIRIRTRGQEGKVELFVKVKHPMNTGLARDKATKKMIPSHFIKKLIISHKGKIVADCDLGIGVSTDPMIGIRLDKAKNGDSIEIQWRDNRGEKGTFKGKVDL